jgi:hypothetical protein
LVPDCKPIACRSRDFCVSDAQHGTLHGVCFCFPALRRVFQLIPHDARRHDSRQSSRRIAAPTATASASSRRARAKRNLRTFRSIAAARAVARSHQAPARSAIRPIPCRKSWKRSPFTIAATRLKRPQKKSHPARPSCRALDHLPMAVRTPRAHDLSPPPRPRPAAVHADASHPHP